MREQRLVREQDRFAERHLVYLADQPQLDLGRTVLGGCGSRPMMVIDFERGASSCMHCIVENADLETEALMDHFEVGDRVVLARGIEPRHEYVGEVVRVDEGAVWVQWEGREAPDPNEYVPHALERA